MSLIRRAALRTLLVQPARQAAAFSSIASSRVTRLPSRTPLLLRSFHQIRASWAESDSHTPQQEQVDSETVDTAEPVETREPIEITEADGSSYQPETKRTIYAGNLFFETSEADLKELFSNCGTVASVKLILDQRGRSKGFGFITMETEEQADAAISALHEQVFQGRRLMASKALGGAVTGIVRKTREYDSPSEPSNVLFVGNLPRQMTDRDLNTLFAETPNVTDVRVAIDRRTGQPRGFTHADYVDVESATKAKEHLSKKELYGRWLRLDYGKSSQEYIRSRSHMQHNEDVDRGGRFGGRNDRGSS